jgi:hypothetical protein
MQRHTLGPDDLKWENVTEPDGAQDGPELLPTPTLDNAPIGDVADASRLDKRGDASGL